MITESTRVRLPADAYLLRFYIKEGDRVHSKDTLFSYTLSSDDGLIDQQAFLAGGTNGVKGNGALKEMETYRLKKNLTFNNIRITANEKRISALQQEIIGMSHAVTLGTLPKNRLDLTKSEVIKLTSENTELISENEELKKLINNVPEDQLQTGLSAAGETVFNERFFKAPADGMITHIYIHKDETSLKGEEILTIQQDGAPYIKAFFDQKDLHNIKAGDLFSIRFPDGSSSTGILKNYYNATYNLPDELQKSEEISPRRIAGNICPLTLSEAKKWEVFYKMDVEITKFKY